MKIDTFILNGVHELRRVVRTELSHTLACVLLVVFFAIYGLLRYAYHPGLYMDGVNPDYLASQTLHGAIDNPNWAPPSAIGPIIGNLYHGVQNYYVDLIFFKFFGQSLAAVRLAQGIFGAGIIVLIYMISWRKTRSFKKSILMSLALATNIAFIASFRTQFYITLGGCFWLLLSVFFLLNEKRRLWHEVVSGIAFGLAIYAYFIFIFFVPALIAYVWATKKKLPVGWAMGVGIGLVPYVIGYISAMVALGSVSNTLVWLKSMTHSLAPMSGHESFLKDTHEALTYTRLAISNDGNEHMIFNRSVTHAFGTIQVGIAAFIFFGSIYLNRKSKIIFISLLPVKLFFVASFFVKRLWAHHFVVLVPLIYMIAVITDWKRMFRWMTWKNTLGTFILILLICINVIQTNKFFVALKRDGGVKYFASAINTMSLNARSEKRSLYVFPEWGFYMPFDVLTYNSVRYILDADPGQIKSAGMGLCTVSLAYWDIKDTAKYKYILEQANVNNIRVKTYYQIDKNPAFYVMTGNLH